MRAPPTVAVVGLGYAGQRLAGVLREARERGEISALALVDTDQTRAVSVEHDARFKNVEDCVQQFDPSHLCVCTNERDHYDVFKSLQQYGRRNILSEKPLVTPSDDLDLTARLLEGHEIRMNLLERHSEALSVLARWSRAFAETVEVLQIEAFWGKHRVRDPRPTMGVLSELIHPLDLCLTLAGSSRLEIRSVGGRDCSWVHGGWCDSLDMNGFAGSVALTIHSSFSWPRRDRRLVLLLRAHGELFRAVLTFDNPHWDQDQLLVERIDVTGRYDTVMSWDSPETRIPSDGLNKLRRSVESWLGTLEGLPDLKASLDLQEVVNEIDRAYRAGTRKGDGR